MMKIPSRPEIWCCIYHHHKCYVVFSMSAVPDIHEFIVTQRYGVCING